jgi:uncharacterized delta-60 repeat protein
MSSLHRASTPRTKLAAASRQALLIAAGLCAFLGDSPHLLAQTEYALDPAPAFTVRSRNEAIVSIAREQADGRIVISGNIRYVDGQPSDTFFRLLPSGQLDPSFVSPTDQIGRWTDSVNGSFLATGAFGGNSTQPLLARLGADGTLDPGFTPVNVTGLSVREVIDLPDGGGYLILTSPSNVTSIQRFTGTGQPAPGYPAIVNVGTGFNTQAIGPAGQLAFLRSGSAGPAAIMVVNAAGVAQPSITSIPSNFRPFGLVYQPDGALALSGQTSPGVGPGVIRILANGQRDLTFSTFNNNGGSNIALLADGSFVTQAFTGMAPSQPHILRFSANGVYLPAESLFLDNGPDGSIGNIQFLPLADGDYLLTGRFLTVDGILSPYAARISPAGEARDSFRADLLSRGRVAAIAPFGAGGHLLAGSFTEIGDANPGNLAVLTASDAISTSVPYLPFGAPLFRSFGTLDGGAVVMGSFPAQASNTPIGIVKLKADGQVDATFLAGVTLNGFEAGVQLPDGRIVLAGRFGSPPSPTPPASYLMRVLPNGGIDPTFYNNSTVTGNAAMLTAVAANPDGSLIVAGSFTTFQGVPRRGLAKTSPDGVVDPSFVPAVGLAANAQPRQLAVLPDGRFYVLGARDDIPGSPNRLLRFNADASIDESFNPAPGLAITAYALAADGSLFALIAGLPPVNGNPAQLPLLAKLTSSGEIDAILADEIDGAVLSLAIDGFNRLLVGGLFTVIDGEPREALARFSPIPFGITIDGPAEFSVLKHSTVTLTTDIVSAPGSVTYQWYQDGVALVGQTGSSLVLTHIVPKHGGEYTVTASVGTEVVTSAPVRLVVLTGKPQKG